jgi:copper oxidase (laccase) domain-containing protein
MDELLKKYFRRDRAPFQKEARGAVELWRFDYGISGSRVYFTNRRGGVSERPYKSLNLGFHVGDRQERVLRNRELLAGKFGFRTGHLTSPRQRHSAEIVEVKAGGGHRCR